MLLSRISEIGIFIFLLVAGLGASGQESNREQSTRKAFQTGEAAMQTGDLATAEAAFLKVLQLIPQDVGARTNLGVVYMREQNWRKALECLNQAQKLAPGVVGIRLNIGLAYYKQGEYTAAIPAFESVVKQQSDSAQARRLLGLCYLFDERYADATADLEPLWPSSRHDVSFLYSLAVAAGNAGRHDLEERAVNELIATNRDSPLLHLLQGKAYMGHEDYVNALTQLRKAADADSKLPMVHYNLGIVYRHHGEIDRAKAEFLQDAALEPNVAFNYDQLGAIASTEGNDLAAERYFLNAVQFDRTLATSWFGLAKAYKQEKRYAEALKALDKAGTLDSKSASVHYLRAQVLAATGRHSEASAEFAVVQQMKKANVDQLELQISGSKYRDVKVLQ